MRKLYHLNFPVDNIDGLQSSLIASLVCSHTIASFCVSLFECLVSSAVTSIHISFLISYSSRTFQRCMSLDYNVSHREAK
jgi:hypothetical protein